MSIHVVVLGSLSSWIQLENARLAKGLKESILKQI